MARKHDNYRNLIDYLQDDDYSTEALEAAIAQLGHKPSAQRAKDLLNAWLKTPPSADPEGMQEITNFATFLILANGYEAAQEACLGALLEPRASGTDTMALFMLGEQLALEPTEEPPNQEFPFEQIAAGLAAEMGTRVEDLPALLEALLCIPVILRPRLVRHLIEGLKTSPVGGTFAALAMLYPLDEASHRELLGPLMASGAAGREFLEHLHPEDRGRPELPLLAQLPPAAAALKPPTPKHLPLDWPVASCFATVPDGRGSQAIYLFRRRPDRSFVMVGAVVNDGRGIVDGLAHPEMSASEQKAMIARIKADAPGTTEVPLEYAIARIREGIALTETKHLPLPFDFQIDRYLLAGLWHEPPIDVATQVARMAANPALTPTDELLADPVCRSHFFVNDGTHGTPGFFKAILPKIRKHGAIDPSVLNQWAESIFDAPMRRLWKGRLEQLAYLFSLKQQTQKAKLAATAALALDPESRVPLADQPWVQEILLKSAAIALGPEGARQALEAPASKEPQKLSETLLSFGEPILAGMPPKTTAKQFQAKLQTIADLWNRLVAHEIAQERGLPSEFEAVQNPKGKSMDEFMNAALLQFLLDRKRQLFPNDRRVIKQVTVAGPIQGEFRVQAAGTEALSDRTEPSSPLRYFQLKVTLQGTKPPIWRRVLVPIAMKLSDLHLVIQGAMGWQNYHMHSFAIRGQEFGGPSEWMDEVEDERKFRLDQLVQPGESFRYVYDFGDDWVHAIKVEKAFSTLPEGPIPRCIGGKRAAPPEDCGGPWGFADWLAAFQDSDDPDHEEAMEILGADYDPEAFSISQAQSRIEGFMRPEKKRKGTTKR